MQHATWFKKHVTLNWQEQHISLAVAQELFSSHGVDAGSRLLLRSLSPDDWPATGVVADFGCGYGVLGLAWLTAKPEWRGHLIDRDALAVAFAAENAAALNLENVVCRIGLGVERLPAAGVDLLLWNVPGKAGEPVLQVLTLDCLGALREGGTLALVVVNPLASLLRDAIGANPAATIVHDQEHAEHTVIHVQRLAPAEPPSDPFVAGVFDREEAGFGVDDFDYDIVPVVGVPEYDTYSHATEVTFDIMRTVTGSPGRVFGFRPGQGHVPLVAIHLWQPRVMVLADRDLLAIRASTRALRRVLVSPPLVEEAPVADLADAGQADLDLVIIQLEDQVRNDLHLARLDDLETMLVPGGQVIVGGSSSVVSRFLSFADKRTSWKLRDRTRRSGASAARLERVQ